MTNLESALAYARRGYRIFPVKPMGKMPLTSMGFKEASVSEAIIRKWWEEWPEANIGLPVPEGLVVVDVDGDEGRQVLVAEDLSLPSSVWAVTPRGSHHWYSMPEGQEASPKVGLFPGIDIRAYGSYVVAPPSCGADGVLYEWRNDLLSCAITEAPEWLVESLAHKDMQKEKIDPEKVLAGISKGARDITLFRYACKLRGLGLSRREAEILVTTASQACDPPFDKDVAMRKVAQAWKYPGPEDKKEEIKIWSLDELVNTRFEQPRWIVDGILPEGLSMLVSGPKQGKSLLAARLALEAGSGTHFLGMFRTNKTGVLYLDLEDTPVFAAERWIKINRGARVPSECKTSFRWNRMDDGGLDTLERALDDNPEIGLVVIDILSNFWPADTETGGNTYHKEYAIMNQLGKFADDYGVCCLLVHHDRKVKSGVDMLGGISGTRAMTGAAKTLWILNRDYESTEGKLFITGKHVRERRVNLSFDQETLRWEPTSHLSGET